ncbi:storkhead-box protein 2-like [Stigmatopora nigra]
MKKSRNVRRAWAGSEKDVLLQKQHLSPPLPPRFSPSPPSFRASADVSPVGMSPVGQSQFIPLGEILCLAVSAMNAAHKPVSQEALVEHLAAGFPGVPTPSPEAVRHALNGLVRERKIYPTAEGYFLVTPQSYFITPSLIRSNNKWYHLDDRLQEQQASSPRPPPSASPKPGERPARKSREDPRCPRREEPRREEPRREEPRGETPKERRKPEPPECGEPSPPRLRPSTSPPEPADKVKGAAPFPYKTDTLTKKKEANGEKQAKRFGLRLFRLSFKKERTRQLATFSAQFPPEEWPLRDEEAPGGAAVPVPREIEMEIIRRINPDLTVENVARHTAVMKRLEEERAQRRRAGSSAPPRGGRGRRGRGHRRVPHGKSRSHSKPRTSRGEPSEGSDWDLLFMERDFRFFSHSLVRSPREAAAYTLERRRSGGGAAYLVHSNPNLAEAYCPVAPEWDVSGELAKRRTEMPFPEPSRGTCQSRVQRSHSHNQDRKSRHERSDRAKERSRSMDNSLQGPGPDSEAGPEERSHYYTDDGTLRATRRSGHFSRMVFSAAKFHADFSAATDPAAPPAKGGADESSRGKSRDGLPTYGELMGLIAPPPADDYFQCNTSNETVLTAPSPQAKSDFDTPTSTGGRPRKAGSSPAERQTPRLNSPRKEDAGQAGGGGSARQTPEPPTGARLTPHQHNADTGGGVGSIKRKEIFSKDTLFKPPLYADATYSKSGTLRKAPHAKSTDAPDNPDPQPPSGPSPSPALRPQSTVPAASFDYYNVSDDEEAEGDSRKDSAEADQAKELRETGGNGAGVGGVGGGNGAGGEGTIKWLLEREKEHDLQRKLESNLTLLSPKETENGGSQKSAHSARLDSMDSSSVTVDSGFNSPRTRESLASNTSSIVESNRRQNPALSPGHHVGGAGLPFAFRAAAEAPAPSQADKLQKPANCLASITSV